MTDREIDAVVRGMERDEEDHLTRRATHCANCDHDLREGFHEIAWRDGSWSGYYDDHSGENVYDDTDMFDDNHVIGYQCPECGDGLAEPAALAFANYVGDTIYRVQWTPLN